MGRLSGIKKIGKEKILLLALAGIILIMVSYLENVNDNTTSAEETTARGDYVKYDYQAETEKSIREMVGKIKGVSGVSVLVSLKSGSEKVLKEDSDDSKSEDKETDKSSASAQTKRTTVIFQNDGNENPYVVKEIYPEIQGIAVAAKGVSDGSVKEEIINMISALFDLPVHKISVVETN